MMLKYANCGEYVRQKNVKRLIRNLLKILLIISVNFIV